jgi:multicomponent K+:H+ antiporter subunit E
MSVLIPHPLLSVALLAIWLLLNTSLAAGHVLLGATLAIALPLWLRRCLPPLASLRRPGLALRFALRVLWDIVVANVRVAILVLGPKSRLRPGFVTVPLDLRDGGVATLLGGIITLTPGTVSLGIDEAVTRIEVHVLDLDDGQALVAEIKRRYETPLKEIFGC